MLQYFHYRMKKINNIQVSFPDITYKLRKLIYNMRYKRINIQIV